MIEDKILDALSELGEESIYDALHAYAITANEIRVLRHRKLYRLNNENEKTTKYTDLTDECWQN